MDFALSYNIALVRLRLLRCCIQSGILLDKSNLTVILATLEMDHPQDVRVNTVRNGCVVGTPFSVITSSSEVIAQRRSHHSQRELYMVLGRQTSFSKRSTQSVTKG